MTDSAPGQFSTAHDIAVPKGRYMPVRLKCAFALTFASIWAVMSYEIARRWISDLSALIGAPLAMLIICGVAILLGYMNAFLVTGLLMDRRPRRRSVSHYPDISILVAAYKEEDSILSTLESIALQKYAGHFCH